MHKFDLKQSKEREQETIRENGIKLEGLRARHRAEVAEYKMVRCFMLTVLLTLLPILTTTTSQHQELIHGLVYKIPTEGMPNKILKQLKNLCWVWPSCKCGVSDAKPKWTACYWCNATLRDNPPQSPFLTFLCSCLPSEIVWWSTFHKKKNIYRITVLTSHTIHQEHGLWSMLCKDGWLWPSKESSVIHR